MTNHTEYALDSFIKANFENTSYQHSFTVRSHEATPSLMFERGVKLYVSLRFSTLNKDQGEWSNVINSDPQNTNDTNETEEYQTCRLIESELMHVVNLQRFIFFCTIYFSSKK